MVSAEDILNEIQKITQVEFEDIIEAAFFVNFKLRLVLKDKSIVDVGISKRIAGDLVFIGNARMKLYIDMIIFLMNSGKMSKVILFIFIMVPKTMSIHLPFLPT